MFNREYEAMPLNKMRELQLERLKWSIGHAYKNNAFYRKKFDDAGFHPDQFKTLDDMKRVPFLTKQDMRDNYPFGLFAVPMDKVVRVHSSSGTTGNATVVGYTKKDVEMFAEVVARCLVGLRRDGEGRHPGRVRIRALHRRTGPPLRLGEARRADRAHLRRQHRAPAHADQGLRHAP